MKPSKLLSTAFVGFLTFMLILPTADASTKSYSSFSLWNLQISSPVDGNLIEFNYDSSSSTVSVFEPGSGQISDHRESNYAIGSLEVSNPYATAATDYPMIDKIDVAASVFIPDVAPSPLEAKANGVSLLSDRVFIMYFEDDNIMEKPVSISFEYQSILEGFSGEQFGFFDTSLSVNINLRYSEGVIPLFVLNDQISGENSSKDSGGKQRFAKTFDILTVSDGLGWQFGDYHLEISVDAKAYASTEPTPEPSAILLLGSGLIAAFFVIRRKNS